jgi:hypothetical protein
MRSAVSQAGHDLRGESTLGNDEIAFSGAGPDTVPEILLEPKKPKRKSSQSVIPPSA